MINVPEILRALKIGTVFTHGRTDLMPDSWVKYGDDLYRRTYDWIPYTAATFRGWDHIEITEPVTGSLTDIEAHAKELEELKIDAILREDARPE